MWFEVEKYCPGEKNKTQHFFLEDLQSCLLEEKSLRSLRGQRSEVFVFFFFLVTQFSQVSDNFQNCPQN